MYYVPSAEIRKIAASLEDGKSRAYLLEVLSKEVFIPVEVENN